MSSVTIAFTDAYTHAHCTVDGETADDVIDILENVGVRVIYS